MIFSYFKFEPQVVINFLQPQWLVRMISKSFQKFSKKVFQEKFCNFCPIPLQQETMSEVKGFVKFKRAPEKLTCLTADLEKIISDANSSLQSVEDQDGDNLASVQASEESIEKI